MENDNVVLRSGQMISGTSIPFITHYGIILVDSSSNAFVLHNCPRKGKTILENLNTWRSRRKVLEVVDTDLCKSTNTEILELYNFTCSSDYQLINYNCEHFVNCMMKKPIESNQVKSFSIISLLMFIWFS